MLTLHYLSFLVKLLDDYRFAMLQLQSLTKWFPSTLRLKVIDPSFIHDKIYHKLRTKEGSGLANGCTHLSPLTIFFHLIVRDVIIKVTMVT